MGFFDNVPLEFVSDDDEEVDLDFNEFEDDDEVDLGLQFSEPPQTQSISNIEDIDVENVMDVDDDEDDDVLNETDIVD